MEVYSGRISGGSMRAILLVLAFLCGFWTSAGAQTLKPGDAISISVYQDPKLDRQLIIDRAGFISVPLAGRIRASGLTPGQLEDVIKARIKDKFTEEPDVTVAIGAEKPPAPVEEDLKPRIFVTGEVLRPGFFTVRLKTNVLQAISLAGGFGPYAAKRRIQVRRQVDGTEVMYLFDYVNFHKGRNVEDNIDLLPGDVVIIPERNIFEWPER
jgi:polysaccharide export outer membrane protein